VPLWCTQAACTTRNGEENPIMQRRLFVLISAGLFAFIGLARAQEPAAPVWKAGVAKVNITPDQLMWMSGYASRTKPAEGKLTDLWAKALVLEDPHGRRLALVTFDLVGIERDLSLAVRDALKTKYGLGREAVCLAASHTHSGPVVRSNLNVMYNLDETQQKYVTDYAEALQTKLTAVVGEAMGKLAPAQL